MQLALVLLITSCAGRVQLVAALRAPPGECQFRCDDGSCVSADAVCNGPADCQDGSDETAALCRGQECSGSVSLDTLVRGNIPNIPSDILGLISPEVNTEPFRCSYGACIVYTQACNGIRNCADGSDETEEACGRNKCESNQFRCDYGACIFQAQQCNGVKDCWDGSDEKEAMCSRHTSTSRRVVCPVRTLRYCDHGRSCYHKRAKCNGKKDCSDGSDEKPELCGGDTPTTIPTTTTTTTTTPAPPKPPPSPPPLPPVSPPPSLPPDDTTLVFPPNEEGSAGGENNDDCLPPSCRCPQKHLGHVCLPCHELVDVNDTCNKLDTAVCSMDVSRGASAMVLSCGAEEYMSFAAFERRHETCQDSKNMVPVLTVVYADCWGTATLLVRCQSDGYWWLYGEDGDSEDIETRRMQHLCQPRYLNSEVCGRRPPYDSTGTLLQLQHFYLQENRWPWVAGLKKREVFECTATLITPLYLLTAAHCVTRSQESSNKTMDVRELRVQLSHSKRHDRFVHSLHLHPAYLTGSRPRNDVALVRLERPLQFNKKLYPACVDLSGEAFLSPHTAVTFSRENGVNTFEWEQLLQHIDPTCYYRSGVCSLPIDESEFCGVGLDHNRYLVGGSSGGPFLLNTGTNALESWSVSGVVSTRVMKEGCNASHTIFSLVSAHADWIQGVINGDL